MTETDSEVRYVLVEKEVLAATWACEHSTDYTLGDSFL